MEASIGASPHPVPPGLGTTIALRTAVSYPERVHAMVPLLLTVETMAGPAFNLDVSWRGGRVYNLVVQNMIDAPW